MLMLLTLKTKFKKPDSCNVTVIITVNCQRNATKNIIFAKNSISYFTAIFSFYGQMVLTLLFLSPKGLWLPRVFPLALFSFYV
jgi:hypothetical protein